MNRGTSIPVYKADPVYGYTLRLGKEEVHIKHNDRRLYKFTNWRRASLVLEGYIRESLEKENKEVSLRGYDIKMISVNPMRRSMFGSFFLDMDVEVLSNESGELIGTFESLTGSAHLNTDGYDTHEDKEIQERGRVEKRFGADQYGKEKALLTQGIQSILQTRPAGQQCLEGSDPEVIDDFVTKLLTLTGWREDQDNRIRKRIQRLPPDMVVPE